MEPLVNIALAFIAGIFAPLAAVCVLPLYPGFLSFLSAQLSEKDSKKTIIYLGLTVTFGVIFSMFIFGLIFVKIFQTSLTNAIGIISPIAFAILGFISLFLIFDFDFGKFFPRISSPLTKNPFLSALLFGLFFGAIVLPCNPASLVILFALSTSTTSAFINLLTFIFFGLGMAMPLLIFSIISAQWNEKIIGYLVKHKRNINLIAGLLMLTISLYYLIFVFRVFG